MERGRAQANFQGSFPVAIVALFGVVVAGRTGQWTALGGGMWLAARVAYLPLYAMGIPKFRTPVFPVSMAGLVMVLCRYWQARAP